VQIVDARNPLRFRCEDLESYVLELEGDEGEAGTGEGKRKNLLLINKADLLTTDQRREWVNYFERHGIEHVFYSAASAVALQQARQEAVNVAENGGQGTESTDGNTPYQADSNSTSGSEESPESDTESEGVDASKEQTMQDPRLKILSAAELEEVFVQRAPHLSEFVQSSGDRPPKLVVGLVGYPNVGKSSTINSLLGEKKVGVSSTPGTTKHFQTIHLSDSIMLCDCPGLVFPQFTTTKADLVCDGILPIDQLREYTGPTALVAQRIPKDVLDATYGVSIKVKAVEEGGDSQVSSSNFLKAYATARGYMRSTHGNPDEARAARYVLKDYVNGKLLFCHPPPGVSPDTFNEITHYRSLKNAVGKKRAKDSDTFIRSGVTISDPNRKFASPVNSKSNALDREFFEQNSIAYRPHIAGSGSHAREFTRLRAFPHQNTVADDGTPLDPQRVQLAALLDHAGLGKKHHKKMKRGKQRSGRGYDDD
jgi:large subunit GTPase 1